MNPNDVRRRLALAAFSMMRTCSYPVQGRQWRSSDVPGATVEPPILRGVVLPGIDSVMAPTQEWQTAWSRLAHDLKTDRLSARRASIEPTAKLPESTTAILGSKIRNRSNWLSCWAESRYEAENVAGLDNDR
jgi:hypothetical protein